MKVIAKEMPGVIPMISYEDGVAALDWLARAFGFRERTRMVGPDGRLAHGEMEAGDGLIMLATPTPDYENPKRHREHCERTRRWSIVPWVIDGVLVYVDNIDEHYARAKREGATILSEPEDGPLAAATGLKTSRATLDVPPAREGMTTYTQRDSGITIN